MKLWHCHFWSYRFTFQSASQPVERGRYQSFAGLLACVAIAVMTHHVTALATVAIWLAYGIGDLAVPRHSQSCTSLLAICAASAALIVACWMFFVAPGTRDYLSSAGHNIVNGLTKLGAGPRKGRTADATSGDPLFDRSATPAALRSCWYCSL